MFLTTPSPPTHTHANTPFFVCLQPHQDHPDRSGAVLPAEEPVPAPPDQPPDALLHRLHRRQQGQSDNWTCAQEQRHSLV